MTRIALVCEPPDGGAAQHVHWLALGLPRHGYEPIVLVPRNFAHLDDLRRVCEVVTVPFRRDYAHPHDDVLSLARLVPVLRRTALVHSHWAKSGVLGRAAARLARRPAVYTPHGFPFVGEISTLRREFGVVVERVLAPLLGAWLGLSFQSFFVDTLHWRHLWLVAALIWAGSIRRETA